MCLCNLEICHLNLIVFHRPQNSVPLCIGTLIRCNLPVWLWNPKLWWKFVAIVRQQCSSLRLCHHIQVYGIRYFLYNLLSATDEISLLPRYITWISSVVESKSYSEYRIAYILCDHSLLHNLVVWFWFAHFYMCSHLSWILTTMVTLSRRGWFTILVPMSDNQTWHL